MIGPRPSEPARAKTHWTAPGTTVGVAALGAFLGAWIVGLPAVLFSALLLAALIVARLETARHLGSLWAEVELPDRVAWGAVFHPRVVLRAEGGAAGPSRDVVVSLGLRGQPPRPVAYVSRLSPAASPTLRPVIRAFERGRCRAWALGLETTYPFGLFRRRLELDGACELLVLPRTGRIRGFDALLGRSARTLRRGPAAGEEDLKALREWRPGDSRRRIHWKVSARRGTTVLRELEQPTEPPVHLVFDARVGRGGRRRAAAFERAVRVAASLVESFRRTRREHAFTLLGRDGATPVRTRGRGAGLALDVLAEVTPQGQRETTPLPVPARAGPAVHLVLICAGAPPASARLAEPVDLVLDATSEETIAWLRGPCGWADD